LVAIGRKKYRTGAVEIIAGVDEAGRGPLAGPVVAAAVILPENHGIVNLRDSKKLSAAKREKLHPIILDNAIGVGLGVVGEREIDKLNILNATYKAMQMALGRLPVKPNRALIDGYPLPHQIIPNEGIIKGDDKIDCIRAASIIAKVERDRLMLEMDTIFPEYGFAQHKGYGTQMHLENLEKWMATPIHRKSFSPVKSKLKSIQWYKKNNQLGWLGEKLAALYLRNKGYTILEVNHRESGLGEIDIIGEQSGELVFIEVKTGSKHEGIRPEHNLSRQKMEKLGNAIQMYLTKNEITKSFRVEAVVVEIHGKNNSFNHIKHVDFNL